MSQIKELAAVTGLFLLLLLVLGAVAWGVRWAWTHTPVNNALRKRIDELLDEASKRGIPVHDIHTIADLEAIIALYDETACAPSRSHAPSRASPSPRSCRPSTRPTTSCAVWCVPCASCARASCAAIATGSCLKAAPPSRSASIDCNCATSPTQTCAARSRTDGGLQPTSGT